jgi:hypothetical protein
MLLWGVLWIWYYTGSLEYDLVLLNPTSSISMFIVLSVLVGAMGKSAQILFHVWLADAMEGFLFKQAICRAQSHYCIMTLKSNLICNCKTIWQQQAAANSVSETLTTQNHFKQLKLSDFPYSVLTLFKI